jgi:hypothetical protein
MRGRGGRGRHPAPVLPSVLPPRPLLWRQKAGHPAARKSRLPTRRQQAGRMPPTLPATVCRAGRPGASGPPRPRQPAMAAHHRAYHSPPPILSSPGFPSRHPKSWVVLGRPSHSHSPLNASGTSSSGTVRRSGSVGGWPAPGPVSRGARPPVPIPRRSSPPRVRSAVVGVAHTRPWPPSWPQMESYRGAR